MSRNHEPMLVSMLVLGYNQEGYIRQAVEGAFAQTYSPLEIILSDDGSQDNTFNIMRDMASLYSGPHKIILNQNPSNLGPGGNLNRCIDLSNGDWLVKADGDDISLPERVERIMRLYRSAGNNIHLIYTGNTWISNEGESLRVNNNPQHGDLEFEKDFLHADTYVLGATCSWSRACATRFGPIDERLHDDHVFPFRAKLLGSIAFVEAPLVNYRIYAGSTVASLRSPLTLYSIFSLKLELRTNLDGIRQRLETELRVVNQKIRDLAQTNMPKKHRKVLNERSENLGLLLECATNDSLVKSFSAFWRAHRCRRAALKIFTKRSVLKFLSIF